MSRGKSQIRDPDTLTTAEAFLSLVKEKPQGQVSYKGNPIIPLEILTELFRTQPRTFMRYAEEGLIEIHVAQKGNLKFVTQQAFDDFIDCNFKVVGKQRNFLTDNNT